MVVTSWCDHRLGIRRMARPHWNHAASTWDCWRLR